MQSKSILPAEFTEAIKTITDHIWHKNGRATIAAELDKLKLTNDEWRDIFSVYYPTTHFDFDPSLAAFKQLFLAELDRHDIEMLPYVLVRHGLFDRLFSIQINFDKLVFAESFFSTLVRLEYYSTFLERLCFHYPTELSEWLLKFECAGVFDNALNLAIKKDQKQIAKALTNVGACVKRNDPSVSTEIYYKNYEKALTYLESMLPVAPTYLEPPVAPAVRTNSINYLLTNIRNPDETFNAEVVLKICRRLGVNSIEPSDIPEYHKGLIALLTRVPGFFQPNVMEYRHQLLAADLNDADNNRLQCALALHSIINPLNSVNKSHTQTDWSFLFAPQTDESGNIESSSESLLRIRQQREEQYQTAILQYNTNIKALIGLLKDAAAFSPEYFKQWMDAFDFEDITTSANRELLKKAYSQVSLPEKKAHKTQSKLPVQFNKDILNFAEQMGQRIFSQFELLPNVVGYLQEEWQTIFSVYYPDTAKELATREAFTKNFQKEIEKFPVPVFKQFIYARHQVGKVADDLLLTDDDNLKFRTDEDESFIDIAYRLQNQAMLNILFAKLEVCYQKKHANTMPLFYWLIACNQPYEKLVALEKDPRCSFTVGSERYLGESIDESLILELACQRGMARHVEFFLKNFSIAEDTKNSLATWAISHLNVLYKLAELGIPLNMPGSKKSCPLIMATRNGDAAVVDFLLKNGGATELDKCLSLAINWGHHAITQLFFDAGVFLQSFDQTAIAEILNKNYELAFKYLENMPRIDRNVRQEAITRLLEAICAKDFSPTDAVLKICEKLEVDPTILQKPDKIRTSAIALLTKVPGFYYSNFVAIEELLFTSTLDVEDKYRLKCVFALSYLIAGLNYESQKSESLQKVDLPSLLFELQKAAEYSPWFFKEWMRKFNFEKYTISETHRELLTKAYIMVTGDPSLNMKLQSQTESSEVIHYPSKKANQGEYLLPPFFHVVMMSLVEQIDSIAEEDVVTKLNNLNFSKEEWQTIFSVYYPTHEPSKEQFIKNFLVEFKNSMFKQFILARHQTGKLSEDLILTKSSFEAKTVNKENFIDIVYRLRNQAMLDEIYKNIATSTVNQLYWLVNCNQSIETLKTFLEKHKNTLESLDEQTKRVIHPTLKLACHRGMAEHVHVLLNSGLPIYADTKNALPTWSVPHLPILNTLVGLKISFNNQVDGVYPLVRAVQERNIDIVRYLLDNGASVNLGDPLYWAIELKEAKIVKLLLNRGAPNVSDKQPVSAFYAAYLTTPSLIPLFERKKLTFNWDAKQEDDSIELSEGDLMFFEVVRREDRQFFKKHFQSSKFFASKTTDITQILASGRYTEALFLLENRSFQDARFELIEKLLLNVNVEEIACPQPILKICSLLRLNPSEEIPGLSNRTKMLGFASLLIKVPGFYCPAALSEVNKLYDTFAPKEQQSLRCAFALHAIIDELNSEGQFLSKFWSPKTVMTKDFVREQFEKAKQVSPQYFVEWRKSFSLYNVTSEVYRSLLEEIFADYVAIDQMHPLCVPQKEPKTLDDWYVKYFPANTLK